MNVEQGIQLSDLRGFLRRRGRVALGIAAAILAIALPVACWLPNQYEAFATILVEPQSISEKLVEAGVAQSDLNRRLHIMTMQILSRGRLSKIIDDLKLYPDESKKYTREQVIELMREKIQVQPVYPEMDNQQAVRRNTEQEINTFQIVFMHDDAEIAAAVANRLANDFRDQHVKERVQVSSDTSDFIEAELVRLGQQMKDVETATARIKIANPGRLPEDMVANQRMLEQTLDKLRAAQRDYAEAQSDEAFYRQQALVSNEVSGTYRNEADPVQRLQLLEIQLAGLHSRGFTEKHPDVIATRMELETIRTQIQSGSEAGGRRVASVAQQNAEAEARRAALRVASSAEAIRGLTAQAEEIQKQLADSPRVAEELAAYDRQYKALFESFEQLSARRMEAGVAANMELRQKGEQVKILEPAFAPPEPISPKHLVIVAVSLMLGLATGFGVAILLESADSSFHGAPALQSALRIPVLSSIPAIVLDADRAAERRHRTRLVAGAAVASLAVVLVSGAGYVYRSQSGAETAAAPGAAEPATAPAPVTPAVAPPAPPAQLPSVMAPPAPAPATPPTPAT